MVASILSKKVAAGSTHLLLDIPIGPTAKVRSMAEAQRLRKLFEFVAARLGLTLDVVITDGRQPIGNASARCSSTRLMRVLQNDPRAPNDLRQKALRLAGRMLEFDPDVRGGDATPSPVTSSSRPRTEEDASIIAAQGARPFDHNQPALARLSFDVLAERDGVVTGIDNLQLARIANLAGAPKVQGAGVDLLRKLGEPVHTGDCLYRVYADFPTDLAFARQATERANGVSLGRADQVPADQVGCGQVIVQATVYSGRPSRCAMCCTKRVLPQPVGPLISTGMPCCQAWVNSRSSLPWGW